MTTDPFAQPNGEQSKAPGDPFGQPAGGGNFPKPADLFGELILLTPIEIESVPNNFIKGSMVDRLTADTVVLTGERAGEEFPSMWWSQSPIVTAGRAALRKGIPSVLGRLFRFPVNEDKKAGKYATREDVEAALQSWKPGQPNVRFAWALEQFSPEDADLARAYLAQQK